MGMSNAALDDFVRNFYRQAVLNVERYNLQNEKPFPLENARSWAVKHDRSTSVPPSLDKFRDALKKHAPEFGFIYDPKLKGLWTSKAHAEVQRRHAMIADWDNPTPEQVRKVVDWLVAHVVSNKGNVRVQTTHRMLLKSEIARPLPRSAKIVYRPLWKKVIQGAEKQGVVIRKIGKYDSYVLEGSKVNDDSIASTAGAFHVLNIPLNVDEQGIKGTLRLTGEPKMDVEIDRLTGEATVFIRIRAKLEDAVSKTVKISIPLGILGIIVVLLYLLA